MVDLMLECKDKEQAVFYLYRLYGLREVDPKVLRPPAEVETLHTNGRKSNKRAKAKAAAAEAAAEAIENGEAGEAGDGEADDKTNEDVVEEQLGEGGVQKAMQSQIAHEAEEHGLPKLETKKILAEMLADDGELDCGSGDEAPEVEPLSQKAGKKRQSAPRRERNDRILKDGGDEGGVDNIEEEVRTGRKNIRKARSKAL